MTSQNYKKIMVDPVQYFPEPQATEKVSAEVLKQIKEYANYALRREIGKKIQVVDQPGPDTVRMKVALTAVGKSAEGLKPYQYVPVALVLTGARAAAGGHPEQATVFLEAEMTDSVNGDRLAIAVRSGTGERVAKVRDSGSPVTLDSVKPLLDMWAEAYADFF